MARAFALKESVTNFAGGSASYGDGEVIDLSDLTSPDGVIVVNDERQIAALQAHPSLKQVAVPKKGGN